MTTTQELIRDLEAAGFGRRAEVDGLAGRDVAVTVNQRGMAILSAARVDGADTARQYTAPVTLAGIVELIDEAHRRLHDDDVAAAHRALHAARTGWALHVRQQVREVARAAEGIDPGPRGVDALHAAVDALRR